MAKDYQWTFDLSQQDSVYTPPPLIKNIKQGNNTLELDHGINN